MNLLFDLLESGWITGLALAVLVIETGILFLLRPDRRSAILANAAAGSSLIGALHAALAGWGPLAVLVFMALALVGHIADLATRLR